LAITVSEVKKKMDKVCFCDDSLFCVKSQFVKIQLFDFVAACFCTSNCITLQH